MGYVSRYGNWGTEDVLVFDDGELTTKQWELLDILPDSQKMAYVNAIIDGEDLTEWYSDCPAPVSAAAGADQLDKEKE